MMNRGTEASGTPDPELSLAEPRSMLSSNPPDPGRLSELTRRIGLRLRQHTAAISQGMTIAIENAIDELVDSEMRPSLHASVENNVDVIVLLLADEREPDDLPPLPDAKRYAVELARRDVSGSALRRAYHVGSDHLLAHMFDQVQEIDCEPHEKLQLFHHLAGWTYQYVDESTRAVLAAYEEEVRSSHERAARTATSYVARVLAGENVGSSEFESATGYRLEQVHIGCRVWIDEIGASTDQADVLSGLIDELRSRLGVRQEPLIIPKDRTSTDVWFGRGENDSPVDTDIAAPVASSISAARIAFGAPGAGPEGFRASRSQAAKVTAIARASTSEDAHVISYTDEGVPIIARLVDDVAETRRWVHEVLGDLAKNTEHAARQRETMRIFLESANSYSRTAARMLLHRNSIRYRLDKAEYELGRYTGGKRLDIQLALTVCRLLGSVVTSADDE